MLDISKKASSGIELFQSTISQIGYISDEILARYRSGGNLDVASKKAIKVFIRIPDEKSNSLRFAMEIFTDAFEQFITIHFSDNTPTDSTSQMDFVRFIFKVKNGLQIFTSVTDVYTQLSRSIEAKNLELFCQKIQWASLKLTTQFIDEMEHICSAYFQLEDWKLEADYSCTHMFACILYGISFLIKVYSAFCSFMVSLLNLKCYL